MKLYEIHYKQLYQKTRRRNRLRLMKPLRTTSSTGSQDFLRPTMRTYLEATS